jgi:hypothetical protein
MNESDTGTEVARMTPEEWAVKEQAYRAAGLDIDEIATLKRAKGPVETGLAALGSSFSPAVLETVAKQRPFYERAAVFDRIEVPRITLGEQLQRARQRGDTLQGEGIEAAGRLAASMGIQELAVTWQFPIARVAFGYTRERHRPGEAAIRGFRHGKQNDGKYPVYAVGTSTEALLVTLSAMEVLEFLHHRGEIATAPADEDGGRVTASV